MARVKLTLPSQFVFKTSLSVRISDINYGGHLGNDSVLGLIHEARFQFLRSLGYENEIGLEGHTGLIVADSVVIYKAEAFHGDPLDIHIAIDEFNRYGFDLYYILLHGKSGKEISRAKTGMVCINYTHKTISEVPGEFIQKIQELEGHSI
jgi:4-hydroxybenzoyl-CoA thioesterase